MLGHLLRPQQNHITLLQRKQFDHKSMNFSEKPECANKVPGLKTPLRNRAFPRPLSTVMKD